MSNIDTQLVGLEQTLAGLVEKLRSLRTENQSLKTEIAELLEEDEAQKKRVKDLEENNKMVKIAGTISELGADQSELKQQVEMYIKEIDKCIALLSS